MRVVAGVLLAIVVLVGAFLGYCYYGAQMQVQAAASTVTPATDATATYNSIVDQLAGGTFLGNAFYEAEMTGAENFQFLTITVRMQNRGLFPMDWIAIEITPNAADVAQLAPERTPSLAANSRGDFSTTILTRAGADTNRKITVTYYVLGQKLSTTYQMGQ